MWGKTEEGKTMPTPASTPPPAPAPTQARSTSASTVFGKTMKIVGEIISDEELYVDGELEGSLELRNRLPSALPERSRPTSRRKRWWFSDPSKATWRPRTGSRCARALRLSAISKRPASSSKTVPILKAASTSPRPTRASRFRRLRLAKVSTNRRNCTGPGRISLVGPHPAQEELWPWRIPPADSSAGGFVLLAQRF